MHCALQTCSDLDGNVMGQRQLHIRCQVLRKHFLKLYKRKGTQMNEG